MRNFVLSLGFSAAALAAGTLCHRLAPGLGLVLMPMFWPLAALAALVPARWSVSAAAIVPFVSFALTGMPAFPFVVTLKFAALSSMVSLAVFAVRSRIGVRDRADAAKSRKN
jgi:hypothetical protein